MSERPILFSAPMVLALLDGTKTQTRRIANKPVRHPDLGNIYTPGALVLEREPQHVIERACPYGQPGDRLWVRETWAPMTNGFAYGADPVWNASPDGKWRPSIHMPRAACRLELEITGVRVERLQDISESDALAEGTPSDLMPIDVSRMPYPSSIEAGKYAALWEQINGPGSWDANPWVWVVEFKVAAQ